MPPRRAARADENHVAICQAFRGCGATVLDLRLVGGGCPDILIGVDGYSVLVEIKAPAGPKGGTSHRNLSDVQLEWRGRWRGESPHVVRTVEDVVGLVKGVRMRREILAATAPESTP